VSQCVEASTDTVHMINSEYRFISCTSSPSKKGHSPQFLAHVYCGQTAGCISIPLGTEVGLDPGDFVLDGDTSCPLKAVPPIFGRCLLWPNCWMGQDGTKAGRPRPRRHCVRWSQDPPKKGARPPIFGPCILWPNSCPSQLLVSSCFLGGRSWVPV